MAKLDQHKWTCKSKDEVAVNKRVAEKVMMGASYQEALEVPEAAVEQFYDYAQELLKDRRFEDAGAVLFVISILCPDRPAVWISYGISRQEREEFDMARSAYEHAMMLLPELAEPYVYAAQCALRMKDKMGALLYITQMYNSVKPQKENKELFDLVKRLEKEINNGR